jgi:predicted nuclease of predicted toxin-antitoxin system
VKVLLDGCVWGGAREALAAAGHDVESTADWASDPGDADVLAHAHRMGQVLITLDKEFGEIAIVRRQRHSGILRLVTFAPNNRAPRRSKRSPVITATARS